jgi:hypothetical protein
MREALAHALTGPINLDEQDWERPIDRLHALAAAQAVGVNRSARECALSSLGVSLLALKAANRPDEYSRTLNKLIDCLYWLKPRPSRTVAMVVARQAIMESVVDHCPTCQGRGEIFNTEGVVKQCVECRGSGKRRYSDAERLEALQLDGKEFDRANRQLGEALKFLAMAEAEAIRTAKKLLEKY